MEVVEERNLVVRTVVAGQELVDARIAERNASGWVVARWAVVRTGFEQMWFVLEVERPAGLVSRTG